MGPGWGRRRRLLVTGRGASAPAPPPAASLPAPVASVTPTAPASGSAGARPGAVRGEIGRLRPRGVLAVGSAVATRLAEVTDTRVVTGPAALPTLSPPPGLAGV